jgi:hypothetical protein
MERDATGKTARAFYEFWNTGDEALPEKALAEKLCHLRRTAAVRAGNDWFVAQQAPRGCCGAPMLKAKSARLTQRPLI